jgi:hypothetical protein
VELFLHLVKEYHNKPVEEKSQVEGRRCFICRAPLKLDPFHYPGRDVHPTCAVWAVGHWNVRNFEIDRFSNEMDTQVPCNFV